MELTALSTRRWAYMRLACIGRLKASTAVWLAWNTHFWAAVVKLPFAYVAIGL